MKDSFIIYTKINEVLKELTDDQKGKLFQAIIDYEMTGEIPAIDDALVKVSFIPVRQDLDVNNEKWEETVKARQEAGRKGGLAKASKAKNSRSKTSKAKNATNKEKQNVANVAVYDNEYVNDCDYEYDNVNDNIIPPISPQGESESEKSKRFIRPTVEQVQEYCNSRNNGISGQEFVDYYDSKGWKVGKSPMKDWKAAVRTWENNRKGMYNEQSDNAKSRFDKWSET